MNNMSKTEFLKSTIIPACVGSALFFTIFSYPIWSGKTNYFTLAHAFILSLPCLMICYLGSWLAKKKMKNQTLAGHIGALIGTLGYAVVLIISFLWLTNISV